MRGTEFDRTVRAMVIEEDRDGQFWDHFLAVRECSDQCQATGSPEKGQTLVSRRGLMIGKCALMHRWRRPRWGPSARPATSRTIRGDGVATGGSGLFRQKQASPSLERTG